MLQLAIAISQVSAQEMASNNQRRLRFADYSPIETHPRAKVRIRVCEQKRNFQKVVGKSSASPFLETPDNLSAQKLFMCTMFFKRDSICIDL